MTTATPAVTAVAVEDVAASAVAAVDVALSDLKGRLPAGRRDALMRVGALFAARSLPLSAHAAAALHLHVCCAAPNLRHLEYFYDHVRIERLLFDGVAEPQEGVLYPDLSRPGIGLELKELDAAKYRVA